MKSQHNAGTHPFLWQASIIPVLIHFYDKPASYRYSSIFMTSQHNAGTHPFLWQASIIPVLVHFMTSQHNAGTHPFFKTSQHNTGTHPFYIGMYIHICTHIYVHIYIYFPEGMFTYFFQGYIAACFCHHVRRLEGGFNQPHWKNSFVVKMRIFPKVAGEDQKYPIGSMYGDIPTFRRYLW